MNPLAWGVVLLGMAVAEVREAPDGQLLKIKRLYVDKFGGGEGATQIRDMLIASLQKTGLFVITENPDKADAVLRGSGEDLVYTDVFQTGETVGGRSNASGGRAGTSRNRAYAALGAGVNDGESMRIQERKHEASASVRIVSREGDVVWAATGESQGAKFRSASADVADKIARQLTLDMEKAGEGRKRGAAAAVQRQETAR